MTLSDPVANMLTTIRNANMRGYKTVIFPYSSFKWQICKKLEESNFLSQCYFDQKNRNIKVDIKYNNQNSRIHEIKKISKPSQHIHLRVKEIKKYCRRHGIYLISTSLPETPLLTHREALTKNQGGKVIFFIS
jgi:small subunit ribosomal protein S8